MILHIHRNALLRPVRSILDQFGLLLATIFDPKTLQNGLRAPIEKSTKLWNPFFEFLTISGSFRTPKWSDKFTPTTFFPQLFSFAARLGAKVGPRSPQDPIWDDLWPILKDF